MTNTPNSSKKTKFSIAMQPPQTPLALSSKKARPPFDAEKSLPAVDKISHLKMPAKFLAFFTRQLLLGQAFKVLNYTNTNRNIAAHCGGKPPSKCENDNAGTASPEKTCFSNERTKFCTMQASFCLQRQIASKTTQV
jgi:hypothetical protein